MNRLTSTALAVLATATCLAALPSAAGATAPTPGHESGVYVVRLKSVAPDKDKVTAAANALVAKYGGQLRRVYYSASQAFSVTLDEDQHTKYLTDPAVTGMGDNQVYTAAGTRAEPVPWGLDRIDQRDLPLDGAYTAPNPASNVQVYVLDTGIRTSHRDFEGRAHAAYDAIGSTDRSGTDCNGHGTEVAGAIGGHRFGVAKGVQLESVRALGCDGTGTTEQILSALDWVSANAKKPALLNLSFAGPSGTVLDIALYKMTNAGLAYTAAAGNGENGTGADACDVTPARQTTGITVGATDRADRRPGWSNFGSCVDVYAPGKDIPTTASCNDTAVTQVSGTSIASAEVAGAAAMYLSGHPDVQPVDLAAALAGAATKDKITEPGADSNNLLLYTGK